MNSRLVSGSCHLDRASNVEIGVEHRIFVIVTFSNCSRVVQFGVHLKYHKGALTQKRSFLVVCTTFRLENSCRLKKSKQTFNTESVIQFEMTWTRHWCLPQTSQDKNECTTTTEEKLRGYCPNIYPVPLINKSIPKTSPICFPVRTALFAAM